MKHGFNCQGTWKPRPRQFGDIESEYYAWDKQDSGNNAYKHHRKCCEAPTSMYFGSGRTMQTFIIQLPRIFPCTVQFWFYINYFWLWVAFYLDHAILKPPSPRILVYRPLQLVLGSCKCVRAEGTSSLCPQGSQNYFVWDWAFPLNLRYQTRQRLYPRQVAVTRGVVITPWSDFHFWLFLILNFIFNFSIFTYLIKTLKKI